VPVPATAEVILLSGGGPGFTGPVGFPIREGSLRYKMF